MCDFSCILELIKLTQNLVLRAYWPWSLWLRWFQVHVVLKIFYIRIKKKCIEREEFILLSFKGVCLNMGDVNQEMFDKMWNFIRGD